MSDYVNFLDITKMFLLFFAFLGIKATDVMVWGNQLKKETVK